MNNPIAGLSKRGHRSVASRLFAIGVVALCGAGLMSPVVAKEASSSATIEVIGGPHAGKYTLLQVPNGCNYSERSTPRDFNSALGRDSKNPKALTMVRVNLRKMTGATQTDPANFDVSVSFGPVMNERLGTVYFTGYNATSGRKSGAGTVTFKDAGQDVQVTFDLKPQPGIVVKGTVTCTVLRY
jgi:hypothetical protein